MTQVVVFVEQDDMCEGSNLYNLFAIKNHLDIRLTD